MYIVPVSILMLRRAALYKSQEPKMHVLMMHDNVIIEAFSASLYYLYLQYVAGLSFKYINN